MNTDVHVVAVLLQYIVKTFLECKYTCMYSIIYAVSPVCASFTYFIKILCITATVYSYYMDISIHKEKL